MQRVLCFAIACVLWFLAFSSAPAAEGNCWVVAVAMCQHDGHPDEWNQFGEEYALAFKENAKSLYRSVQTRTVLGRGAGLPQIVAAVRWAATNAKPNDLVVITFSAHGGTTAKDGWSMDTMDGQVLYGRDLKAMAARLPCPVLFVIDTCGSGGFTREHAKDIPLPPNCVALCSSRARQETTNVLCTALNEALWGQADANRDGFVNVNETVKYVETRTRRLTPPGATFKESEMPVMAVGSKVPGELKLLAASEKLVAVPHGGQWHLARVKGETADKYQLHLMGCHDDPNNGYFVLNESPKERVFKLDSGVKPVMVTNDKDRARTALLLNSADGKATVRYMGQGKKKKNEDVVDRSQVKFPFPNRE